jgi:hypothetical protein
VRARVLVVGSSSRVRAGLALLLYAVVSCYYTWPLVTDLNGTIYGSVGDLTGGIANLRELLQQHQIPFRAGTIRDFDAPTGVPVSWALNLAMLPGFGFLWVLGLLFGATAAYGIYTLVAFTASAWAMYLLVRKVTGSELAAVIAGYAFGFYPFAILNGQGHADFSHGWPFVLVIWRMLELRDNPSRRNGLLAGLAATLAISWTAYYLLLAGVVFATLFVVTLIVAALRSRPALRATVKSLAWTLPPLGIYFVIVGLATRADATGQGVRTHNLQELIVYSARWYEYVVPPVTNPIFGDGDDPWLRSHLHGSNFSESRLYIGVSCILLAVAGLALVLRRTGPWRAWLRSPLALTALTAAIIGVVAFVWSAPPKVALLGHEVPTPSNFVFHVTSTFRAYSRFVVPLMAAVCLLAGIGIAAIIRDRRRPVAVGLAALLGLVVVTDTWGRIHPGTNKLSSPAIYSVLRKEPKGIVAEYPLEPAGYGVYAALFYQQDHGHPVLNGYLEGTPEESRALQLSKLDDPKTPAGLAALGVKYVLLTTQPVAAPNAQPGVPVKNGLKLIGRDRYARLYRVTARPALSSVTVETGFSTTEGAGAATFNWMTSPSAQIHVTGRCAGTCHGTLRFGTSSFAVARDLAVLGEDGRVLRRLHVKAGAPGSQSVRVPLIFAGEETITLRVSPGPQSVQATDGGTDSRSVAITVAAPVFTLSRR